MANQDINKPGQRQQNPAGGSQQQQNKQPQRPDPSRSGNLGSSEERFSESENR